MRYGMLIDIRMRDKSNWLLTLRPIVLDMDRTFDISWTTSNWILSLGRRVKCKRSVPSRIHSAKRNNWIVSFASPPMSPPILINFHNDDLQVDWWFDCNRQRPPICIHSKWDHNCLIHFQFCLWPNWDNCWFHSWMKWPVLGRPAKKFD